VNNNMPSRSGFLALLRAHQAELRAAGVEAVTIFGSVARDDAHEKSDVDMAIRAGSDFSTGGFDYFGRLEALRQRLVEILGRDVDLVEEPVAHPALAEEIRREGVRAF